MKKNLLYFTACLIGATLVGCGAESPNSTASNADRYDNLTVNELFAQSGLAKQGNVLITLGFEVAGEASDGMLQVTVDGANLNDNSAGSAIAVIDAPLIDMNLSGQFSTIIAALDGFAGEAHPLRLYLSDGSYFDADGNEYPLDMPSAAKSGLKVFIDCDGALEANQNYALQAWFEVIVLPNGRAKLKPTVRSECSIGEDVPDDIAPPGDDLTDVNDDLVDDDNNDDGNDDGNNDDGSNDDDSSDDDDGSDDGGSDDGGSDDGGSDDGGSDGGGDDYND